MPSHLLLLLAEQGPLKSQHLGDVQVVLAEGVQALGEVIKKGQDEHPAELQRVGAALE